MRLCSDNYNDDDDDNDEWRKKRRHLKEGVAGVEFEHDTANAPHVTWL